MLPILFSLFALQRHSLVNLFKPKSSHSGGRTHLRRARIMCNMLHNIAGIGGYVIPSDVRSLLDQLKDLAESLALPKEEGAEEAATQPGEEKLQKKLPPQLNPLLAKLARASARENEKSPGKPIF